jgi:uncharacterized protein with GYD domain
MGMKITDAFWTMGAYDVVVLLDAPDDETATAFALNRILNYLRTRVCRRLGHRHAAGGSSPA